MRRNLWMARWRRGVLAAGLAAGLCLALPGAAQDEDALPAVPVYIEDSPAAQELAAEAQHRLEQQRQTEAVELLQQITERYPHKLMMVAERRYTDAALWVRQRLLADPALLVTYGQVFGAAAERARAEALSARSIDGLEAVVRRYALTPAGLPAALDLAAMHLERADAVSAAAVLEEMADHPGLQPGGAQAVRYHALQAVSGLLIGDDARLGEHRTALRQSGDSQALATLEFLAAGLNPPRRVQQARQPVPLDLGELPSGKADPLWQARVGSTLAAMAGGAARVGRTTAAALAPIVPAAGGDDIYVANDYQVAALDRSSGRRRWSYAWDARPDERLAGLVPSSRFISDSRSVLVGPERVYAVVGLASNLSNALTGDGPATSVVALDRSHGDLHWRVAPGQVDVALERAYFVGTPVADYGQVLVLLVRRAQMSGFQDTYVAALDADTGAVRWRRHISSTVTSNRHAQGPMPAMRRVGSRLIVSDNLGAVAALDARSGMVRWVRVLAQAQADVRRGVRLPSDAALDAEPVVVPAGLIVPTANANARLSLLDPATGELLRDLDTKPFSEASRFTAVGDDLLGLGRKVVLYNGRTLDMIWAHELGKRPEDVPVGDAAVTAEHVLVPLGDRVVALSRATGEPQWHVYTGESGRVVALPGQVLLATAQTVRSYQSWARAYADLQRQMAEAAQDPGPGLAMAHLALEVSRSEAVLAGVDHALRAMQLPGSTGQAAGFEQLLELARPGSLASPALRGQILDRLATASRGVAQETAYQFVRGAHQAQQQRPREAAAHYQTILLDPSLSRQMYVDGATFRQAGLEARRRLEDLIARYGPAVYERYEVEAAQRLRDALQRAAGPGELMELAHQYPLASASGVALWHAGRHYQQTGDDRQALRALQQAYRRAEDPRLLAAIAGSTAQVLEEARQPLRATRWLQRLAREHPGLNPTVDGQVQPLQAWIDRLSALQPVAQALRPLQLPLGEPRHVVGRLLRPTRQAPADAPADRFMAHTSEGVRLITLSSLQPLWRQTLALEDPQLLSLTREHALLMDAASGQLVALDAESGAPLWGPVEIRPMLEALAALDAEAAEGRTQEQRDFMRQNPDLGPLLVRQRRLMRGEAVEPEEPATLLVQVTDAAVIVADRAGRVVALDRGSGERVWQHRSELTYLSDLAAGADVVALTGTAYPRTEAEAHAAVVLDLASGEERLRMLEETEPIQAASVTDDGLLITLGGSQLTARQVADGAVAWRLEAPAQPFTQMLDAGPVLLTVLDQAGLVHAVDAQTGQHLGHLAMQRALGEKMLQVERAQDRWHVLTPQEAMAVSGDGELLWRDGISVPGAKQLVAQWVGEEHVVVAARLEADEIAALGQPLQKVNPAVVPGGTAALGVFILDRTGGALLEEHYLGPLHYPVDPQTAVLLENALLIASGDSTLVLPGAGATTAATAP